MIYTLTLNPSVDYIVSVDYFKLGKTNRTTSEMKNPGGKGINVSRVLTNLNVNSKALGFVGGFTGGFIEEALHIERVETDFIKVDGDSRINNKLRAGEETEINGQSPSIGSKHIDLLRKQLQVLRTGDILVLAGSVPDSLPSTVYNTLIQEVDGKGVKVIIDTSGKPLKECLAAKPFLIKPNHHELGELFNRQDISIEEAVSLGKMLIDEGVQNIIVSMAGEGALLINQDKILRCTVPKVEVKNSVGAGDSVVAGFIASYTLHNDLKEAFRYAIAAGTATALSEGFCKENHINELLKQVIITNL